MIENLLIHRVSIKRPTVSPGESGGEVVTMENLATNLPALVQPVQATWKILYDQKNISISHTVFLNTFPGVQAGDVISFGNRTLELKGFRNLQEMNRVFALDAEEIYG